MRALCADLPVRSYPDKRGEAMKYDILIAGVGGQGVVLASRMLALAAMKAGFHVSTAETIGMSQTGRFREQPYKDRRRNFRVSYSYRAGRPAFRSGTRRNRTKPAFPQRRRKGSGKYPCHPACIEASGKP